MSRSAAGFRAKTKRSILTIVGPSAAGEKAVLRVPRTAENPRPNRSRAQLEGFEKRLPKYSSRVRHRQIPSHGGIPDWPRQNPALVKKLAPIVQLIRAAGKRRWSNRGLTLEESRSAVMICSAVFWRRNNRIKESKSSSTRRSELYRVMKGRRACCRWHYRSNA